MRTGAILLARLFFNFIFFLNGYYMKKINNNKFSGNAVYSLNYKFDSVSAAGKCSGTALDLIKRYNELAKEAQSNGNYVEMEVFRQYAEHYRKIVTEINERKKQYRDNQNDSQNAARENSDVEGNNNLVETQAAEPTSAMAESTETPAETPITESQIAEKPRTRGRRSLKIVEVNENPDGEDVAPTKEPRKRRLSIRPRKTLETAAENTAENAEIGG